MLRLGYSPKSMSFYRCRWRMILEFAKDQNEVYYSEKLGIDFIEKTFNILQKDFNGKLTQTEAQNLRIIRLLGDFQLHGSILRRYNKHKGINVLSKPYFKNIIDKFKQYCINKEYCILTIENYTKNSAKFLDYADSQGIVSCNEISLDLLNSYIKTIIGFAHGTLDKILKSLKSFSKFMYLDGLNDTDYSFNIPKIKQKVHKRIPSTWTVDNIKKLISVIDRGSPLGKRDYAIILLACRLGLRTSDIKKLKLENFHWEKEKLIFTQSKTGNTITLPLLQDVGWAVIDYLKYGRPKIDIPYVFFRLTPPFLPFSEEYGLDLMIKKYMKKAHIPIFPKKRVGMHSLRHTLASLLLENDTPLPTISNILGHVDINSTAIYLKVDIKKLKECPLNIMEDVSNE